MPDFTSEIIFKTSRSSGAGGQNVNKVETAVTALWNVAESRYFTGKEKSLIAEKLSNRISSAGILQLTASEARTQLQNRKAVAGRITAMVEQALVVPKARIKTRPSRAKVAKRLEDKNKHAEKKNIRKFRF